MENKKLAIKAIAVMLTPLGEQLKDHIDVLISLVEVTRENKNYTQPLALCRVAIEIIFNMYTDVINNLKDHMHIDELININPSDAKVELDIKVIKSVIDYFEKSREAFNALDASADELIKGNGHE